MSALKETQLMNLHQMPAPILFLPFIKLMKAITRLTIRYLFASSFDVINNGNNFGARAWGLTIPTHNFKCKSFSNLKYGNF